MTDHPTTDQPTTDQPTTDKQQANLTPIGRAAALQPVGVKAALLALLIAVLWGGNPVAVRFSTDQLPPIAVAAIRFYLAAWFMWFWCRIESTSLTLQRGELKLCVIAGILMFAQIALFHVGVARSSSSHGTILINTFVIWVAVIEFVVLKTGQLNVRKAAGLLLAGAAGLLVIVSTGQNAKQLDQPTLTGDVILMISAVLFAVKMLYTQYAVRTIQPGRLIFWHDVIGVILLIVTSAMLEDVGCLSFESQSLRSEVVVAVLYQGVFVAGLCYAIQAMLLKKHPASQVAVFASTTPIFGILFGTMFRGDALSGWLIVGGLCAACGIYLVTVAKQK